MNINKERFLKPLRIFWQWTGFGEKKLWDFLDLLIVPLILAIGGYAFQEITKMKESNQSTDKYHQDILINYLNDMTKLLENGLLNVEDINDSKFIIAQGKTLITLESLDPIRQHLVLQFLKAAHLNPLSKLKISKGCYSGEKALNGILYQAQMSGASLMKMDLSNTVMMCANFKDSNLAGSNLSESEFNIADFTGANLTDVNFTHSILFNANFTDAILKNADFTGTLIGGTNLTNTQIKMTCNWEKAIYTGGAIKNVTYTSGIPEKVWVSSDPVANEKIIDKIKQDKATDSKEIPDCKKWQKDN